MARLIKSIVLVLIFYVAPLLGVPERILQPQILFLMLLCIALFLTQPELSIKESKDEASKDRASVLVILIGGAISQVVPVVEWGYFQDGRITPALYPWLATGAALLLGGLAFRIWAIRLLGSSFTATVQTSSDQQVISSGPYAVVRHPSYLGAYLGVIGSAVLLHAPVGIVVGAVVMGIAYVYRIIVEEEALVAALGDPYRNYQLKTRYRLIPGIW